jgi:hypothetical protein
LTEYIKFIIHKLKINNKLKEIKTKKIIPNNFFFVIFTEKAKVELQKMFDNYFDDLWLYTDLIPHFQIPYFFWMIQLVYGQMVFKNEIKTIRL